MIELICKTCGKSFDVTPPRKNTAKYCSVKCYSIGSKGRITYSKLHPECMPRGKNHPRWKGGLIGKTCLACKKIFRVKPCQKDTKKYCSKNCANVSKVGQVAWNKGKKFPQFSGKQSSSWKGGKTKHIAGYICIYNLSHPFSQSNGYILEHRLIVEKQIGRYLLPKEKCHHSNEIKSDNRPENLMGFTSESAHQRFHHNPDNVKSEEIIFDGRKLIQ